MAGTLYYGDNLTIMRKMPSASVDLIYLDPPFNSQKTYNLIYRESTGLPVPEQEEAFCDSWILDADKETMARNMPVVLHQYGVDESLIAFWEAWINALRNTQPRLLAYLVYMSYRLLEMRRLLKPTGSIYLHCDPTASHYIKVIMDGIFGHENFRNEVYWYYYNKMHDRRKKLFPRATDTLLFYVKDVREDFCFHQLQEKREKPVRQLRRVKKDGKMVNLRDENGQLVYQTRDVKTVDNVWRIPSVQPASRERLGFPTQKPLPLLRRIIAASSNPGDVVFDPFCGCGTSIYAAHELGRTWIGCDIAILSVGLVRRVLKTRYGLGEKADYKVDGVPTGMNGARELFKQDPRQFQNWVVELAGGFVSNQHSGDQGIDGRIYFETDDGLKSMVISVKGGKPTPAHVRELRGVLERDRGSWLAGFICLQEPTAGMLTEAATAGQFEYDGTYYDRIQIRTTKELLQGVGFDTPARAKPMNWERQGVLAL